MGRFTTPIVCLLALLLQSTHGFSPAGRTGSLVCPVSTASSSVRFANKYDGKRSRLYMSEGGEAAALPPKKGFLEKVCGWIRNFALMRFILCTHRTHFAVVQLLIVQSLLLSQIKSSMPPAKERKKLVPLAMMFFFILFNYTILRDTKDVLMVTAKKSGAEVIPFIKTYVNLPAAIGFTALYSKLCDKMEQKDVFYACTIPFLIFFLAFAFVIFPNVGALHPHAFVDKIALALPEGFGAPLAIVRNWSFAVFYVMAEMWGSVVASLLFWSFANEVTTVDEAKKYCELQMFESLTFLRCTTCYLSFACNKESYSSSVCCVLFRPSVWARSKCGPHLLRTVRKIRFQNEGRTPSRCRSLGCIVEILDGSSGSLWRMLD